MNPRSKNAKPRASYRNEAWSLYLEGILSAVVPSILNKQPRSRMLPAGPWADGLEDGIDVLNRLLDMERMEREA
jgi:hypothetical protein